MKRFLTLMQREWLQYRFGWFVAALLPLGLALGLALFDEVQIDADDIARAGAALPALLATGAIVFSIVLVSAILETTSLIIVSGLPRRDHGDRSIEFWLSVPVGHGSTFAAPLLVHLILVPAAALAIGLVGGFALSAVLVGRLMGLAEWFALPWGQIVPAAAMVMLRLLAGLPLAILWLSPLVLLVMLLTAWARAWGWVLLAVGLGLVLLLDAVFGPLPGQVLAALLSGAARSMLNGANFNFKLGETLQALEALPAWLMRDLGYALRALASPTLAAGLAFAAACFALLMQWRRRGAAAAG